MQMVSRMICVKVVHIEEVMSEMIRTIAEVASAHHGNLEKLKSLTKKAAEAKFDCVKIQVFKVEELLTRDKLINSKLGENEFSREEWTEYLLWFDKNFRELGFKIILEPFGLKAFQMVQDIIKFDALKLPTSDFCDLDFARALSKKTNHLYMGIGGAYEEEIEYIMRKLKLEKDCPKISLIHGFQAYPTEISDADIWKIHYLKDKYKVDGLCLPWRCRKYFNKKYTFMCSNRRGSNIY